MRSKTDFPTEFVRIRLMGDFDRPQIYQVENFTLYTKVDSPSGSPKAHGWYEKSETGVYYLSEATRVHKGITYYEYTPSDPKWDTVDSVTPRTDVQVNGIMTLGFGPEIYKTASYRDPESKEGYVDLSQSFNRTNTPFFQINPGMNDFVIIGNVTNEDAFAYFEPVEITW